MDFSSLSQIAKIYSDVVSAFIKRPNVLNGKEVSYHDNQDPNGNLRDENWLNFGETRVTTGLCVSFSQALLNSQVFQFLLSKRNAKAKLISIEIKEQFYGVCKPSGTFNKWHTAILVQDVLDNAVDQKVVFIVDPTVAQFGNQFVGKLIWDFESWCNTFRSANDKHVLTDFDNNTLNTQPYVNNVTEETLGGDFSKIINGCVSLNKHEQDFLGDFIKNGIQLFNKKIMLGTVNNADIKYIQNVNSIIEKIPVRVNTIQYSVLYFRTKDEALNWIRLFAENGFRLDAFVKTNSSLETYCQENGLDINSINAQDLSAETYIVLRFKDSYLPTIDYGNGEFMGIVQFGLQFDCDPNVDIYNMGKELATDVYSMDIKTNTICINLTR